MKLIKIGKIVNTHGIKGELRLLSKFPYKEKVFIKNMKIYINKESTEIINTYRKHKNFDMITLEGYSNINEVLKYKGKIVYVDSDDIKLDKNKYLDEQLIGLNVIYNNSNMGIIINIERYDKTTLFNIKGNSKEYVIPYNDNLIDKIDIENNEIYIKDIKGLFE
ncbi:MAG: 16S rRNA processing protein RimM [Bacilli bacterium]|nr:16S rRNA processing protein RimM [Bacilli bacterium]